MLDMSLIDSIVYSITQLVFMSIFLWKYSSILRNRVSLAASFSNETNQILHCSKEEDAYVND